METKLERYDYTSSQDLHPSPVNKNCPIPFAYIHPSLTMTLEEINRVRDENVQRLLNNKMLHLVLDLDHTLVHTRLFERLTPMERKRIETIDDVYKIFGGRYVVKLRPGLREFLKQVTTMFDVSIYTMGNRLYAEEAIKLLKIEAGFPKFSWVITREDCIVDRQKALDVVLSHEQVVVIVDDTEGVWEESCMNNLIKIGRYDFFPVKEGIEELDNELARICNILKAIIHGVYYDDHGMRDVRELIKLIPPSLGGRELGILGDIRYDEDKKVDQGSTTTICRKRSRTDDMIMRSDSLQNICVPEKRCKKLVVSFSSIVH